MVKIPTVIEKSLKDYVQELSKVYSIERAILFGSLAHGTAKADSDIDLAIFSTDATDQNRLNIMADCWLRTMPYKLDIQPVVFPAADYYADNDFIQQEIIGRGIEIPIEQPTL